LVAAIIYQHIGLFASSAQCVLAPVAKLKKMGKGDDAIITEK